MKFEGLNPEEQAINYVTMRHIEQVRNLINNFIINLLGDRQLPLHASNFLTDHEEWCEAPNRWIGNLNLINIVKLHVSGHLMLLMPNAQTQLGNIFLNTGFDKCDINKIIIELIRRGEKHDQSKLASPEVELFTEYTDKLADVTYGSDEYNEYRKLLQPALDHHYASNRHHPEHFKHGVNDMNIIDVIEMLCDWKAASMRHNDGNIRKSIEINRERFKICSQLGKILENSVDTINEANYN